MERIYLDKTASRAVDDYLEYRRFAFITISTRIKFEWSTVFFSPVT